MPRNNLTPRKLRRKSISSVAPSRDGQHAYDPILKAILVSKDGVWQLAVFDPVSLFANGEQGVWYDPSDLTTLFQDHQGTIPAAFGQPVGLMLDKSRGLTTGPELVVGTGPFVKDSDASLNIPLAEGVAAGKTYEVIVDVVGKNASGPSLAMGGGITSLTAEGDFTLKIVWSPSSTPTSLSINGTAARLTVARASVREILGNHASQPTVTARPTLGRVPATGRRNLLVNSEDIAVWSQGALVSLKETTFGIRMWEVADNRTDNNMSRMQSASLKASTPYIYSGYVKRGLSDVSMISMQGAGVTTGQQARISWDTDGTLLSITGAGEEAGFEYIGNGVYRFWKPLVSNETGGSVSMYIWPTNFTAGGDLTGSILVGNLQLEEGTEATPYQRVGSSALDVTEAGVPSLHYLDFDGVDDRLMLAMPLHRPNVDWMQGFRRSTLDTMAMLSNDNLSAYLWAMAQGTSTATNSNAGTPQYFANGKQVTVLTRRGLSDAIPLNTSRVLEARGADLANAAAWSEMGIGTAGWSVFKAHVYGVIMRDAMTADERDNAREWLADRSGATL